MSTEKNREVSEQGGQDSLMHEGHERVEVVEAGPDRREHHRIQVMLEVDYRAADPFLFAYITDISAMGIFVRTSQPEPPGTHLYLRFTPQGGDGPIDSIECEGDVIWINPPREGRCASPGMGIRFTDLADDQRSSIVELVRTFAWLDADDEKPQNCH